MDQRQTLPQCEDKILRHVIMCAGLLLVGGCARASANELLASELVYTGVDHGWSRTVQIDPWLSKRPELARAIMAAEMQKYATERQDCTDEHGKPGCTRDVIYTLQFDGSRLVSVLEEGNADSGGAHPSGGFTGHLYDASTGKEIAFGDIFKSWRQAKPELQARFCKALSEIAPEAEECPDLDGQGLTLARGEIQIHTSDYALGSYAGSRQVVTLWINGETGHYSGFAPLFKDEYLLDVKGGE